MDMRFYENDFPEVGEVVMIRIDNIGENSIEVSLLEYNRIKGMILIGELTRRRIRSIKHIVTINSEDVAIITKVDKDLNFIDLSKKLVYPEDIVKCKSRYNKSKMVNNIMRYFGEKNNLDLQKLYQDVIWPLYKKHNNESIHLYDTFKLLLLDQNIFENLNISEEIREPLTQYIKKKIQPQPQKVRSEIEITCFQYSGIDSIKEALTLGQEYHSSLKINILAPPIYMIYCMTIDPENSIIMMKIALEIIKKSILDKGGTFEIKGEPKISSTNDEEMLLNLMEELEEEQKIDDSNNLI